MNKYEVARLFTDGRFERQLRDQFENIETVHLHLAPPLFARIDPDTGRPLKRRFGPWITPLLRLLAKGKRLRGTPFDIFGHTTERRTDRALVATYEADLDHIIERLSLANHDAAIALARWPMEVRGYGIVRNDAIARAKSHRAELLVAFNRAIANTDNDRNAAE